MDGRRCEACAGPIEDATALAVGVEGHPELGSFLSVERWPGWFTVRHHLADAWKAMSGGDRGRWRTTDGCGPTADGVVHHAAGGAHGWTSDISFVGTLDPAAAGLTLTLEHRGEVVLDVVLPLAPVGDLPT